MLRDAVKMLRCWPVKEKHCPNNRDTKAWDRMIKNVNIIEPILHLKDYVFKNSSTHNYLERKDLINQQYIMVK